MKARACAGGDEDYHPVGFSNNNAAEEWVKDKIRMTKCSVHQIHHRITVAQQKQNTKYWC